MKRLLLIMIVAMMAAACHRNDSEMVARAYDNYLYRSDIEGLVAPGTSAEDSIAIVTNYINQWIQQQVVLEKAKRNVGKDFDKELQNYKNSLITYQYEQLIVEQLLDTNVSDAAIAEYYEANAENFVLRSNILRCIYLKLPNGAPCIGHVRRLMNSTITDETIVDIQEEVAAYAVDFSFDSEKWIPFYTLQTKVPIDTYNEALYLRQNKLVELDDEEFTYLVRILEFKTVDDISPLEFERQNIKEIILNHRKIDIIKNMQRDLLKEANAKGKIEIVS